MSSMCGGVNSSGQPTFHLRRIGPAATKPGVADVMDFHRVTYMIGRNAAQCDFIIDSSNFMQSKCLSRCHARIVRQAGNQHRVYDDSLNGVFVNNMKIAGSCVLREGDRVTFGHLSGSRLPSGSRARQPDSEYQFMFEQCTCPTQGTEDSDNNQAVNQDSEGFQIPMVPNGEPSTKVSAMSKRKARATQSFTPEQIRDLKLAWDKKDGGHADQASSEMQVDSTIDTEEEPTQLPMNGEVPDMTKGTDENNEQNQTDTATITEHREDVVESSKIQKHNQSCSDSVKEATSTERDVKSSVPRGFEDAVESILQDLSAIQGIVNNNEEITDITGTGSVLCAIKSPTKDVSIQTSQTSSLSESSEILKLHNMSPTKDANIQTSQSLQQAEKCSDKKSSSSEVDMETEDDEFVNTEGNSQAIDIKQTDENETANRKETSCLIDGIETDNPIQMEDTKHSLVKVEKSKSIVINEAESELDADNSAIDEDLHDDSSSNVDIILISESESETINISSASEEDVEHKSNVDEVKPEIEGYKDNANVKTGNEHETTITANTSYEIDLNTSEIANRTLECYPAEDGEISESEETSLEPMQEAKAKQSIDYDNDIKVASPGSTCLVDYASSDGNDSDNNTDTIKEEKETDSLKRLKSDTEDENSETEMEDDSHECVIMGKSKAQNQILHLNEKTDECDHNDMPNASAGLVFSDSIDYDFEDNNDEIAKGLTLSDSVEFGDDYDDDVEEDNDSETNDKEGDVMEEENECKKVENDTCENVVDENQDTESEIVLEKQGFTENKNEESTEIEKCHQSSVDENILENIPGVLAKSGEKEESVNDINTPAQEGLNLEKLVNVEKRQTANEETNDCVSQTEFGKTDYVEEHLNMQQEAVEKTKSQMNENNEKDYLSRYLESNKIIRKRKTTDDNESSDSEQECVKRKRSEDIESTDKKDINMEQASPLDRPKFEKIKHHFKKFLNFWSSKKKYKVTESEKATESYFYVQDLAGRYKLLELEGPVEKSKCSKEKVVNEKISVTAEINQETKALNVDLNKVEMETNKETTVHVKVDKKGVEMGENQKFKDEIKEEERDVSSQGEVNYQCINETANEEFVCQKDNQEEIVDSVMENDSTVKTDIFEDQEQNFKITEIKTENKEIDNDPKDKEHSDLKEAIIESDLVEDKSDACCGVNEDHEMLDVCNEAKYLEKVVPESSSNDDQVDSQNEDLAQSDHVVQDVSTDVVEASVCYTDEGMDSDDEILNTSWIHPTPATPQRLSQVVNSSQLMSPIIAKVSEDKVSARLSPLPVRLDLETASVEIAANLKDKNEIKDRTDNDNLSCDFSDDDNGFVSPEIDFTHLDDDDDVDYDSNENEINSDNDNVSEDFDPEGDYEKDEVKSFESNNERNEVMSDNEKDEGDFEENAENDLEIIEDSEEERDLLDTKTDDVDSDREESDHDNIEDTDSADENVDFDFGEDINDEMPETDEIEIEVNNSDSEDEKIDSNEGKNNGKETKLPTKRKCNFEENSSAKKTKPFECKESSPKDFEQSDSNNYLSEDKNATPKKEDQSFNTPTPFKTPVSFPRLKRNDRATPITSTPKQSYLPTPGTSTSFSPLTFSSTQLMDCTQTPDLDLVPESQMDNITEQLEVKVNEGERSTSSKKKAKDLLAKLRAKKAMKVEQSETTLTSPPHSSSQGRELEVIYRRQTPARLTLEKVDSHVNRCRQVIDQLQDVFNCEVSLVNNPRVQAWRKELREVESKLTFPKTIIAVVGDTGAGKSSLMNAILDHRSVLPTSGMRACTAVVVKVIQNTQSTDLEADIEFLQRKEWFDELRILLKDLTGLDGTVKNRPPDPTSDGYVSYCKIRAVYGKIDTFEVLSRYNTVTHWLGRVKTIKSKRPEQFRQLVEKYIETQDPGAGGQYWPIVKHVVLKLPNCDVCSSGAALVDLPGVRDSNAARDKIAREYLKNCTAVWVVSSIHRAIDDKTAKELLGENFRRQLLMDGQYGSIAFICTKTDVLMPSEIIRSLKLEAETRDHEASVGEMEERKSDLDRTVTQCTKELRHLNKTVATLKSEVQELRDSLTEIGSLLDPIDVDSEQTEEHEAMKEYQDEVKDKEGQIETVEGRIEVLLTDRTEASQKGLELEKQLNIHRKAIAAICARARNEYSKTEIKRDFKAGLREMKRRAGMMDTSADDDEDDDDDSDNDDEDIGSTADNLQVFCCSSTEYQKMKNLLTDDGPPQVFSSVEDTQIPALRNYVHEMTSIRRQQSVERLIHSLGRFVFDLQSYTADGQSVCSNTRLNAKYTIDAQLHQFDATLAPVIRNLSLEIDGVFDGSIRQKMEEGATNAAHEAIITCAIWGGKVNKDNKHDRKTGGIAWGTYRAAVRRQGTYTSPTFGPIDFNEQLTEPMYRCMTVIWDKAFSGMLWKILDKLKTQILQKLKEFTTSLCGQLESLGVPRDRSGRVGAQLHGSATNKLNEMVGQLKEIITNRQRDISRIVTPHIQTSLQAPYDTCVSESGSGMFARMKGHMTQGIDGRRFTMFDEATQNLMVQLVDLQNEIIQFTQDVCKTLMQDLRAAFEPLWEAPSNFRVLRSAFLQPVTVACSEVREIYSDAGLENTEESTTRAVVAAAGSSSVSGTENTGWKTFEKSFHSQDDGVEKYGHLGVRVKTEKLPDNCIRETREAVSTRKSVQVKHEPHTFDAVPSTSAIDPSLMNFGAHTLDSLSHGRLELAPCEVTVKTSPFSQSPKLPAKLQTTSQHTITWPSAKLVVNAATCTAVARQPTVSAAALHGHVIPSQSQNATVVYTTGRATTVTPGVKNDPTPTYGIMTTLPDGRRVIQPLNNKPGSHMIQVLPTDNGKPSNLPICKEVVGNTNIGKQFPKGNNFVSLLPSNLATGKENNHGQTSINRYQSQPVKSNLTSAVKKTNNSRTSLSLSQRNSPVMKSGSSQRISSVINNGTISPSLVIKTEPKENGTYGKRTKSKNCKLKGAIIDLTGNDD